MRNRALLFNKRKTQRIDMGNYWKVHLTLLALFARMAALWDDEGSGDSTIVGSQNSVIGLRKHREMPIRCLPWISDPSWEE